KFSRDWSSDVCSSDVFRRGFGGVELQGFSHPDDQGSFGVAVFLRLGPAGDVRHPVVGGGHAHGNSAALIPSVQLLPQGIVQCFRYEKNPFRLKGLHRNSPVFSLPSEAERAYPPTLPIAFGGLWKV